MYVKKLKDKFITNRSMNGNFSDRKDFIINFKPKFK